MSENLGYSKDDLENQTIEALLELPFTDIADAIGFALPPKGAYNLLCNICQISTVGKEDKEAVVLEFEITQTIELEDMAEEKLPDGTKVGTAYIGGASIQYLKTHFGDVAVSLGAKHLRDLCEKFPGTTVSCVIGHRSDTRDPDNIKKYPQFSKVKVL